MTVTAQMLGVPAVRGRLPGADRFPRLTEAPGRAARRRGLYGAGVDPDAPVPVQLSRRDLMLLRSGLRAYLQSFARHRDADTDGHPGAEWQQLQRRVGQLLWRLEEAEAPAGAAVVHSEDAVAPA